MGWQPIETAPKDGTKIDVVDRHGNRTTEVWFEKDEWWEWWLDGFQQVGASRLPLPPTYWMPIPEAPEQKN